MKKICFLCAAAAALLLASCCGKDYRTMLPADAAFVMSVNPASMAEKADVGDFEQSVYYGMVGKMLSRQDDLTADEQEYLLSLFAHPEKMGIDMNADVYGFVRMIGRSSQPEGGVLFKVKSRKDMDKFVNWMTEKAEIEAVVENDITFLGEEEFVLAYTGNALLCYASDRDLAEIKVEIQQLFAQKKSESLLEVKEMTGLFRGRNDMQFALSYGPLMAAMKSNGMQLPGLDFMSKMAVTFATNFEPGKVVTEGDVAFADAEAEKKYREFGDAMVRKIDGGFLKLLPQHNMALVAANMRGAAMYEMFEKIPVYAMALAMVPQIKPIMSAIDGDFSFAFHGLDPKNNLPLMTLTSEVNDPAVLETIKGLIPMPVEEVVPGRYYLNLGGGMSLYFALNGNTLYMTTAEEALVHLSGSEVSDYQAHAGRLFGGTYGAMHVDFALLRDMFDLLIAQGKLDREFAMAMPILGLVESLEVTNPEMGRTRMVLHMTDKEKNAAAVIYDTVEGFAGVAAGLAL